MHRDGLGWFVRVGARVIGADGFLGYCREAVTRAWRRAVGAVTGLVID